ncbi:MAG: SHOCT domain-containing protein [Gaiellales bacterium]
MPLAADYPFLDIVWTMILFFVWIMWFWLLFSFLADVFRRRDIGGGKKTLWVLFMIFAPFLGVFVYLLTNHDSMAERNMQQAQAQQAQMDDYVRSVASTGGGAAAEIEKAKALLDSGVITQAEFEALKGKALGA